MSSTGNHLPKGQDIEGIRTLIGMMHLHTLHCLAHGLNSSHPRQMAYLSAGLTPRTSLA
jgi:hypothetical protein